MTVFSRKADRAPTKQRLPMVIRPIFNWPFSTV
jgi:hypothetical protein